MSQNTVTLQIPEERLRDMIITALEGGIGYWGRVVDEKLAEGLTYEDFRPGGKMQHPDPDEYMHPTELVAITPGCALILRDADDPNNPEADTWEVTREKLLNGFAVMAEKYPKAFALFLRGNEDANTADLWVQCALFGEEVYG
jgi:hypothetical protein